MSDTILAESTKASTAKTQIYVAWTVFQRRQVSMAPEVGFDCVFLPVAGSNKAAKALAYLKNFFVTLNLLRERRPTAVWLQLPQVPLLWVGLLYRALFDGKVKVIADCHNAMFRPPWSRFPMGLSLLGHCDCVLVHNEMVKAQALALGVPAVKLVVLEDVPPVVDTTMRVPEPDCMQGYTRPWVVFPGSFAADEPISEVLAAARLLPEINFVITGKIANAARHDHDLSDKPPNVVLPGFLPIEQFDRLLRHADVVMGLTRVEGIQLSVCNEALGFGKPLIVSDTQLLRSLFNGGAALVNSGAPKSIANGIRQVTDDPEHYREIASKLRATRQATWRNTQFAECKELLGEI